jgi:hypothetical protein
MQQLKAQTRSASGKHVLSKSSLLSSNFQRSSASHKDLEMSALVSEENLQQKFNDVLY